MSMNEGAKVTRDQSQVIASMDKLSYQIEVLHDCVTNLEERLHDILLPNCPTACEDDRSKPQSRVILASAIDELITKLSYANNRISSMISRCEL